MLCPEAHVDNSANYVAEMRMKPGGVVKRLTDNKTDDRLTVATTDTMPFSVFMIVPMRPQPLFNILSIPLNPSNLGPRNLQTLL
jgi:hypothetical protein